MKFLVDECVGQRVAEWLQSQGHEVISIYAQSRGEKDESILARGAADNWIILTNDKDFGELVFRRLKRHVGIVLLRLKNERSANKIDVLDALLRNYPTQIEGNFVVVRQRTARIIRPGPRTG